MASIELRSLKKSFGAVDIIHNLDLKIDDGEFVALVGPSGCGKSTLLRMIAGLEMATQGDILIGDKLVNDLNPRERNIAMVFQSYALYPHMTVAQNMAFNLKLSGKSKAEIKTRVDEAARMLDLTALLDRRPAQLSGGQRQRVAMGRAVVRNPAIFLFDEPLSNLDAKLRVQMRAEIKSLHQKVATTSLYVTHDQLEAMTLADRIVVLNGGRIEQQGSPLDLYRNPANLFVAGFIGSPAMNFLEATAVSTPKGLAAKLAAGGLLPLATASAALKQGQALTVGIRPEHLTPVREGGLLSGATRIVEPTGAQTHVIFNYAGQDVVAVVDGMHDAAVGRRFDVSATAGQIHVFDRQSGIRLGH
jgi:multiple sugar transport system ATP-binding protein